VKVPSEASRTPLGRTYGPGDRQLAADRWPGALFKCPGRVVTVRGSSPPPRSPPPEGPRPRVRAGFLRLPADAEPADDGPVPLDVVVPDVVQEPATTTDQPHEASTRVVVALMDFQVLGEVRDALGEERDLDLGRPGVGLVNAVFGNRRKLVWHVWGERPRRF